MWIPTEGLHRWTSYRGYRRRTKASKLHIADENHGLYNLISLRRKGTALARLRTPLTDRRAVSMEDVNQLRSLSSEESYRPLY